MATDASQITLDVEQVLELLTEHDRFLQTLQDLVRAKLAEEERSHLTLLKGDDDA